MPPSSQHNSASNVINFKTKKGPLRTDKPRVAMKHVFSNKSACLDPDFVRHGFKLDQNGGLVLTANQIRGTWKLPIFQSDNDDAAAAAREQEVMDEFHLLLSVP